MKYIYATVLTLTISLCPLVPRAVAQNDPERQALVDTASRVVKRFAADPKMGWFRGNVRKAQGILIVPTLLKGGFIFGASGGSGVLLGADHKTGQWSQPAFYTMGSVTFGFQAGGEISEIILMIMTKRGMDSFLGTTAKLGADISVAIGSTGLGAKAAVADVIAFSRTRGLYGGLNIEGAVITTRDSWNHSYYGRRVTPSDILIRRNVRNPKSDGLRHVVARVSGGGSQIVPATPQGRGTSAPANPRQPVSPQRDVTPPTVRRDDGVTSEDLPWRKR